MSLSVSVSVNGTPLDPNVVLADVTIRSGRERADDGLSASSATVDLLSPAPLGSSLQIADVVTITASGVPRFTGKVAELTVGTGTGGEAVTTLVAVGALSRLPRLLVTLPLPAATAAARLTSLFAGLGIPLAVAGGTTYNLTDYGAIGDDPVTADQIVGAVMTDTGAIVADGGDGTVFAQFPEARISGETHTPDPAATSLDLVWDMADDMVNDCTVEYGPSTSRATVHTNNPVAIESYDLRAARLSGGLADVGTATRRAASIVSRLAEPAWGLRSVQSWDENILSYHVGALVTLAPLPASAPVAGGSWLGILEGWTERYQPDTAGGLGGSWELAIGDPKHSAETLVWQNATPSEHWSSVNPATAWQDVISNTDL